MKLTCPKHHLRYSERDGCAACMDQCKRTCDTLRTWSEEFDRCERLGLPTHRALQDSGFPLDPYDPPPPAPWHLRARWWLLDRLDDWGINIFEGGLR